MPRKPRFYLPDVPVHVVQRGNARQAVFFTDDDYAAYLDWLFEGAVKHGCLVHAYVLTTVSAASHKYNKGVSTLNRLLKIA